MGEETVEKDEYIELEKEYYQQIPILHLFAKEIISHLDTLLEEEKIIKIFPIHYRIKEWESIIEKTKREKIPFNSLDDITDLVGIRYVLLFKTDIAKVKEIITENFSVLKVEDKSDDLEADQFGYRSIHIDISPKAEWLHIPTLKRYQKLHAEVQIRTGSQHIWASASHFLQYKREEHVPIELRRQINLLSALLELIDNEFIRLLDSRKSYQDIMKIDIEEKPLNTETLKILLDNILPSENKCKDENYALLLDELIHFNIDSIDKIKELWEKHKERVLSDDKAVALDHQRDFQFKPEIGFRRSIFDSTFDRVKRGVYYCHSGLIRSCIRIEYGDEYEQYIEKIRLTQVREKINGGTVHKNNEEKE